MKHICDQVPRGIEVSYVWGQWNVREWESIRTYNVGDIAPTYRKVYAMRVSDIKFCPYCGQDLDSERDKEY